MLLADRTEDLFENQRRRGQAPTIKRSRMVLGWIGALMILLAGPPGWSHDAARNPVGQVTAIQGHVVLARPGSMIPSKIHVLDDLLPDDVVRTGALARSKIFLEDETLLTLGEKSVVEMAGSTYASGVETRSVTVKLTQGKVRALVGRPVGDQESKLIVHTPTAIAASYSTYFVVWTDETVSGVANIGTTGQAMLTSGNRTVLLQPGQFTVAAAHAPPDVPSALINAPPTIGELVASTEFSENLTP